MQYTLRCHAFSCVTTRFRKINCVVIFPSIFSISSLLLCNFIFTYSALFTPLKNERKKSLIIGNHIFMLLLFEWFIKPNAYWTLFALVSPITFAFSTGINSHSLADSWDKNKIEKLYIFHWVRHIFFIADIKTYSNEQKKCIVLMLNSTIIIFIYLSHISLCVIPYLLYLFSFFLRFSFWSMTVENLYSGYRIICLFIKINENQPGKFTEQRDGGGGLKAFSE